MILPENFFPDLVIRENDSVIASHDQPLLTKSGNEFCHQNERLLRHVLTDLLLFPKDDRIRSFDIMEYQIDHVLSGNDLILEHFQELSDQDPFYLLKTGQGKPKNQKPQQFSGAEDISINLTFWTVSSILKILNNFISENLHLAEVADETEEPVMLLMKQMYIRASDTKKAAIALLWIHHQSGLVMPFLTVAGLITPAEYAKGVIALEISNQLPALPEEKVLQKFTEIVKFRNFENPREKYQQIYLDAVAVQDYLSVAEKSPSAVQRIDDWIKAGESGSVEFKSTFRWDLKQNKPNPSVERACLKTICGFLNSAGGILLVGIRDDGSVEGIESDRFANEDKFLLHVWTLIRTSLGRDVSPYIQTILEKREEKTVCIIHCSPSLRPVFLRQPGFDEEFYIRLGPGSAALDISEALKYIADRFREDQKPGNGE